MENYESLRPLLLGKERSRRRQGVPRHQAKVFISVQEDQDQQDDMTEVTVEPKTASPPALCAGEDYFCQDNL